jgi:hypothetical protein
MDTINNIFNLKNLGNSHMSLSKAVLIFYLLLGNNFTNELFSGQLSEFVRNNRYSQHMTGYLIMMLIINSVGQVTNVQKSLLYTTIAYLWFVFTTKLDLQWSLLIIGFMVFGLLYESMMVNKETDSAEDESLKKSDKNKIKSDHNNLKMGLSIVAILITMIGTASYFYKKKKQYCGNFNKMEFLFATPKKYQLIKR